MQTLLHTDTFTHRHFCPQKLLHTEPFTHRSFFHAAAFAHRRFYTQTLLRTEAFTRRNFYTQKLLHTDAFTHTSYCTQKLFTRRRFCTQKRLHAGTFTQTNFCAQKLLHTGAFTHRHFYTDFSTHRSTRYHFTPVLYDQTSFRAKGLRRTRANRNFWLSNLIFTKMPAKCKGSPSCSSLTANGNGQRDNGTTGTGQRDNGNGTTGRAVPNPSSEREETSTTCRSISGFALPSLIHNNQPLL